MLWNFGGAGAALGHWVSLYHGSESGCGLSRTTCRLSIWLRSRNKSSKSGEIDKMVTTKTRRVTITGTAMLLCLGLVTAGSSIVGAGASTAKVPGVTAHQITIGATEPLTGIASAGYNQVAIADRK